MASTSEVWSQLLSWVSLVLTFLLLTPQAYQNYQKQSTQGLSTAMIQAFVMGSIIPAAYYIYQDEPVALTLSWFGFVVVGIFVLCQVPYYAPPPTDSKATAGSGELQLARRRRQFCYHFAAYILFCTLCCVFFYFVYIVSGPSSAFSWLPSAIGYVFPTILTVFGYLLQLRLILVTKDASGISPGFMVLDWLACGVSIASIALDKWDGAAAAPFIVIISCQIVMAAMRYCVYPPNKAYKRERQDERTDTADEGDTQLAADEEGEEGEEDEDGGGQTELERLESGMEEQLGAGHIQSDTSLNSVDEDEQAEEAEEEEEGASVTLNGIDRDGRG